MIFNKIEVIYEKVCLPLKIKYSEIRKPTFMEFLILLIIFEHPMKSKNLFDILQNDFGIYNQALFERALRELINFKIIEINKTKASVGILNMKTPIDVFLVNQAVKDEFKNETYTISHDNRFQDVKYFVDPVTKKTELISEIYWQKRINGTKFTHKLNLNLNTNDLETKDLIISNIKNFVQNKREIFGDSSTIKDVLVENGDSIGVLSTFKEFNKTEQIAIETWIEIFENGTFKIKTEDDFFENYLRQNPNVSNEILKKISSKYEEKLRKTFRPEKNFVENKNYSDSPDLLSNLNIKTNYNLLLINDQHIESDTETIKNKDLTKNINIIIFYNSKRNNRVMEIFEGKIVFFVSSINEEVLNNNSFSYLDTNNFVNSFLVSTKRIETANIDIPVIYAYKNLKETLNLKEIFEDNIEEALEKFEYFLIDNDFKLAMNIYLILERLGLEEKIAPILENYLEKTIDSGENYIEMKKYLQEIEDRKVFISLEKIAKKLIVNISSSRTDFETLELIENYKFTDTNKLLGIIDEIKIVNDLDNIYKINDLLLKNSIDGWKFNIRNSLIVLIDYFKKNNRTELFNENKYTSDNWTQHVIVLNLIGKITKELYQGNYEFVENNYNYLLVSLIDLVGNNLDIKNLNDYLINLSELLKDFYETYYEYKVRKFTEMESDSFDYKIKTLAGRYVDKIENNLNKLIDEDKFKMPLELKLEWIKNIQNNSDAVDKILKNDDLLYKKALNIIFGKQKNYREEDYIKFKNIFGGK